MWTWEHEIRTSAPSARVWARYEDVATWPEWDHGFVETTLDGPFAVGSTGSLIAEGQPPLHFRIVALEPGVMFADDTEVPGMTIRFEHSLRDSGDGATIVRHRVTIVGPAAEEAGPVLGPQITAGVPDSMANLVRLAAEPVAG